MPPVLDQILQTIGRLGSESAADYRRIRELRERLEKGRFHLAVLGQFKRGKSTLLNALLGEAILPTSVIPLTSIPTFIHGGKARHVRVFHLDGWPGEELSGEHSEELAAFLSKYVTEAENPHNEKGVSHVEVLHPAPILQKGTVLIDTPGIGSTFRHNTEATLRFLAECDAALFLASVDPPLTEVEVDFLKRVLGTVPRLFFVLNKVDYLRDEDKQLALDFLRKTLSHHLGIAENVPIFAVSAQGGLEAKRSGDSTAWERSGLAAIENHLIGFLANGKALVLRDAIARKAGDVVADILLRIRLAIRTLQLPVVDLQERLRAFERKLKETKQQRTIAEDLLSGEQKRLATVVESEAERLRRAARDHLHKAMEKCFANSDWETSDERVAQKSLDEAVPRFFERESGEMSRAFSLRVAEALQPHKQRADELIEAVRKTASGIFDVPYQASESSPTLELTRQPHWVRHDWSTALGAIPVGFLARLAPLRIRRWRARKLLMGQIESLVVRNVENLRWSMLQNLDHTFRRFGSGLEDRFQETITATLGAIQAVGAKKHEKAETVAKEIVRLQAVERELAEISHRLQAAAEDG
jgi:hypothetical protein